MAYNICTLDGWLMLGQPVNTLAEAKEWLKHYQKYVGKPYPNGKGFYPEQGYHIVEIRVVTKEELRD